MKYVFFYRFPLFNVARQNFFELFFRDTVIPDPIGLNGENRPSRTNPKTVTLDARYALIVLMVETFLDQPFLKILIEFGGRVRGTTGARADEDLLSVRF